MVDGHKARIGEITGGSKGMGGAGVARYGSRYRHGLAAQESSCG